MVEKTIKLYTFDELSERIQDKVVNKLHDVNVEDEWYNNCLDAEYEKLAKLGVEEPEIFFSGFYSQGDGASFSGKVKITEWLKSQGKILQEKYAKFITDSIYAKIERNGHYYHSNTLSISDIYDVEDGSTVCFEDGLENDLESDLTYSLRETADKIYKNLKNEFESLTTRESIVETIKANEYTFRENGEMEGI